MKKIINFLLIISIQFIAHKAWAEINNNFRNTTWGMSKKQVKAIETAKLLKENDNKIIYSTKIADMNAEIRYKFTENVLIQGVYLFPAQRAMATDYFPKGYEDLRAALSTKYGDGKLYIGGIKI